MNEEVEIKVVVRNPEKVESVLGALAKFVIEKRQKDEYFVPKNKDFFSVNPTKEYLRIRYEEGKDKIEYDSCHFSADGTLLKTDEYGTKISDPNTMSEILDKLGMVKKVTVVKRRRCFEYNGFFVLLDNIENLGCFLEVEAKQIVGSLEETKKRCFEILNQLGAEWEKAPNMGYPDMILQKN